jgi:hypothetical protein
MLDSDSDKNSLVGRGLKRPIAFDVDRRPFRVQLWGQQQTAVGWGVKGGR